MNRPSDTRGGRLGSKIAGKDRGYGKAMSLFVKDRRFAENNREKYLKRTGMMMSGPQGEMYDLQEIYGDLVRRGWLDNVKDIHLTWSSDEERPFRISALMKVASFSYLMDLRLTPKDVIEVMVYEAVRLIAVGQREFGKKCGVRNDWVNHPKMHMAMRWMQENNIIF